MNELLYMYLLIGIFQLELFMGARGLVNERDITVGTLKPDEF